MLERLHEEMPRLGFTSITPRETPSALIAFTLPGAERRFGERLGAKHVTVSLYGDRIRISPSIFNDDRDIERLLEALS
jgi:selenocysteine lyase/cysteine desulfurase